MRLVRALDRERRVTAVPFQKPGVAADHGLTVAACEAAAWAIAPDGTRFRGAAAVNAALAVALGISLPYRVYALPGVRGPQDRVYDWVAHRRSRLPGGVPFCARHPSECR